MHENIYNQDIVSIGITATLLEFIPQHYNIYRC